MSARSDAIDQAAAVADGVAAALTIEAQVLDVESAQALRSGEHELHRSLRLRATWRADEAAGASRAAHVIRTAAIDAYWADRRAAEAGA